MDATAGTRPTSRSSLRLSTLPADLQSQHFYFFTQQARFAILSCLFALSVAFGYSRRMEVLRCKSFQGQLSGLQCALEWRSDC